MNNPRSIRSIARICLPIVLFACSDSMSKAPENSAPETDDWELNEKLLEVVRAGDILKARELLSKGADPNSDQEPGGPLAIAAASGNIALVNLLLSRGAHPDTGFDLYSSALMQAIAHNHFDVAALLIKRGARVTRDRPPCTDPLLLEAARVGDPRLIELLVEHGANVNAPCLGIWSPLTEAAKLGNTRAVAILISKGADVNSPGMKNTPLVLAALGGHYEVVRILLAHGANVDVLSQEGTALMCAAEGGHLEILRALLAAGAEVNLQDDSGRTALLHAQRRQDEKAVRLLISHGADIEKASRTREPLLQARASRTYWTDVAVWVIDNFHTSHGALVEKIIKLNFEGGVYGYNIADDPHGTKVAQALEAIVDWSLAHPTTLIVVNMSWGSNQSNARANNLFRSLASAMGFIFIAAAGNDGLPTCSYPAGYDGVIGVSTVSVTENGGYALAPYANHGECVKLATPEINADELQTLVEANRQADAEQLLAVRGTSFSSAQITGILAKKLAARPIYNGRSEHAEMLFNSADRLWGSPNIKVVLTTE